MVNRWVDLGSAPGRTPTRRKPSRPGFQIYYSSCHLPHPILSLSPTVLHGWDDTNPSNIIGNCDRTSNMEMLEGLQVLKVKPMEFEVKSRRSDSQLLKNLF